MALAPKAEIKKLTCILKTQNHCAPENVIYTKFLRKMTNF